ncbi:MAG: hypothetical protein NC218_10565 [Acetobacter sp.]|nr:hypothetical protein [Acetobacter sp.]
MTQGAGAGHPERDDTKKRWGSLDSSSGAGCPRGMTGKVCFAPVCRLVAAPPATMGLRCGVGLIFNERAFVVMDCHVANAPRNDGGEDGFCFF